MEALLKFDVGRPRALASHGRRVIFEGAACLNYMPLPIPTIPTLPIRLIHHHVLPSSLTPPTGSLVPTPADSLALSLALSLSLSSLSLFFLFLFLLLVVYRTRSSTFCI